MRKLRILYVANNKISDFAEFGKLKDNPALEELVALGNPCYQVSFSCVSSCSSNTGTSEWGITLSAPPSALHMPRAPFWYKCWRLLRFLGSGFRCAYSSSECETAILELTRHIRTNSRVLRHSSTSTETGTQTILGTSLRSIKHAVCTHASKIHVLTWIWIDHPSNPKFENPRWRTRRARRTWGGWIEARMMASCANCWLRFHGKRLWRTNLSRSQMAWHQSALTHHVWHCVNTMWFQIVLAPHATNWDYDNKIRLC